MFVADLHRTRRKFIHSKSFVQLKIFCADEITVDGCSMDIAYETRMQWVHNGWQDLFTFYILFASVSAVGPGLYRLTFIINVSFYSKIALGPVSQITFFRWQMTKLGDKSADNQSEARISRACNKNCQFVTDDKLCEMIPWSKHY